MTKIILPKITISEPERKWLELLWYKIKNKENYNYRTLKALLYKDLPKNFHPKQMSRLLVDYKGERITLLGIFTVDPKTSLLEKTNRMVSLIKELLINSPATQKIVSSEISESLQIPEEEVGLIFNLLTEFGWFVQGASLSDKYFGYSSIDIGDKDEVFDQYTNFNSIEELIQEKFDNEELKRKEGNQQADIKDDNDLNAVCERGIVFNPIFKSKLSQVDSHLCFVIMPFDKEWSDRVYKLLLREPIESLGLQCIRADNLNGAIIVEDIWIKINQAAFIIADVTDKNPNVMYEMGIVHSIGKPTILITQDLNNIPFDFKHLRHHGYKDNAESFKTFSVKLKEVVFELYKNEYQNVLLNYKTA